MELQATKDVAVAAISVARRETDNWLDLVGGFKDLFPDI